jgi:excisionase family DNA binding protein
MQPKPMNIDELAAHFSVSKRTVRKWMEAGMPVLRPSPKIVRFDAEAVMEWMKQGVAV